MLQEYEASKNRRAAAAKQHTSEGSLTPSLTPKKISTEGGLFKSIFKAVIEATQPKHKHKNAFEFANPDVPTLEELATFPNSYVVTKRIAEALLLKSNQGGKVPMILMRPSILCAALEEPFPGWIDSGSNLTAAYMMGGLGLMKEMPGDPNSIADHCPVDYLVNLTLTCIAATI